MDRGAHYFRCDFQVHSPRDLQWSGPHHETDAERREYAFRFIRACREKQIDAVAITDHHDLSFVSYIREAARSELDQDGAPISAEKQIVVFPGMELTLSVPCQALLILDADFPDDEFETVLATLAIEQNDAF